MLAVQYDGFGGIDVLEVREVPEPTPDAGEVLVAVRAAGINPGEAGIRSGALAEMFPSTFPSGQGTDLAGVVVALGDGVTAWRVDDEVVGWVHTRSSHAERAVVPADQLVAKPASLGFETAGGAFVAGTTAWAAVESVALQSGDVVVVSGAAGGVGGLVVQLAVERGARVLGVAGEANHAWLTEHRVTPIDYAGGPGEVEAQIRAAAPDGVVAFVDTVGGGYVDLAVRLGVATDRIDTIIDFEAAERLGVQTVGSAGATSTTVLSALLERLDDGRLELPVAATFALADVRAAFEELEGHHARGKVVLLPQPGDLAG